MNHCSNYSLLLALLGCLLSHAAIDPPDVDSGVYGDTYDALMAMLELKRRPVMYVIHSVQWLSTGLGDRREILEVEALESTALKHAFPKAAVFRVWSVPSGQDFTHSYNFDSLVIQDGVMLLVDSDASALRLLNSSKVDVRDASDAERRATAFLDLRSYSLMQRKPTRQNLRQRESRELRDEEWGMLAEPNDEGWVVRFTCLTELKSLTVRRYTVHVATAGQMSILDSKLIHVGRLVL